jgi:hypothetical protein
VTRDELIAVLQSFPENLPVVYATSELYEQNRTLDIAPHDLYMLFRDSDGSIQAKECGNFYSSEDEGVEKVIIIDPTNQDL